MVFVPVKMYGSPKCKLNPIHENTPVNPFNHTLDRKDTVAKKVVLRIKQDIEKINRQIGIFNHMFFEKLTPKDNLMVKIDSLIDFKFVYDKVKYKYRPAGRKSEAPAMMTRGF